MEGTTKCACVCVCVLYVLLCFCCCFACVCVCVCVLLCFVVVVFCCCFCFCFLFLWGGGGGGGGGADAQINNLKMQIGVNMFCVANEMPEILLVRPKAGGMTVTWAAKSVMSTDTTTTTKTTTTSTIITIVLTSINNKIKKLQSGFQQEVPTLVLNRLNRFRQFITVCGINICCLIGITTGIACFHTLFSCAQTK